MKKLLLLSIVLLNLSAFASDKLHVKALEDYSSENPKEVFQVELLESKMVNELYILDGSVLNCKLLKVKDPKRAKMNAKVYFRLISYDDNRGQHKFPRNLTAKYAKKILNKEAIKSVPPKTYVKAATSIAGDMIVPGISTAVSFVDGAITNQENDRLVSGAKQVYKDSILSYVEYGEAIEIKKDDVFYLVVTPTKKRDLDKKPE
ncbi:MAG: hypothetical protein IJW73_03455 [Candidatus Gastranaerophilales bacterium]|nr:hypothetical protein [Candidatus Gastranaerophilales bacterium]